jgi:hypothetical protein
MSFPSLAFVALIVSVAIGSSGCALGIPQSAEVDGSGQSDAPQVQTASCGSLATLDRYFAGSGDADIEVLDGAGKAIYDTPAAVTGEVNDQVNLSGSPGTWTLNVSPNGFAGQFKVTLQCL